jgi:hypothetical protein
MSVKHPILFPKLVLYAFPEDSRPIVHTFDRELSSMNAQERDFAKALLVEKGVLTPDNRALLNWTPTLKADDAHYYHADEDAFQSAYLIYRARKSWIKESFPVMDDRIVLPRSETRIAVDSAKTYRILGGGAGLTMDLFARRYRDGQVALENADRPGRSADLTPGTTYSVGRFAASFDANSELPRLSSKLGLTGDSMEGQATSRQEFTIRYENGALFLTPQSGNPLMVEILAERPESPSTPAVESHRSLPSDSVMRVLPDMSEGTRAAVKNILLERGVLTPDGKVVLNWKPTLGDDDARIRQPQTSENIAFQVAYFILSDHGTGEDKQRLGSLVGAPRSPGNSNDGYTSVAMLSVVAGGAAAVLAMPVLGLATVIVVGAVVGVGVLAEIGRAHV